MIRRAKMKDIPRLLDLLEQVNMVHHNGRPDLFYGPATKYNKEELEKLLDDQNTFIFVSCDQKDHVLGYAFCLHQQHLNSSLLTDIRTLYIDDICVDEKARHQHIGKSLWQCQYFCVNCFLSN